MKHKKGEIGSRIGAFEIDNIVLSIAQFAVIVSGLFIRWKNEKEE